ncbi:hypothetical protein [Micromonospora eburnea]|nr:hypothetical protein [Micromonospora eburnea]
MLLTFAASPPIRRRAVAVSLRTVIARVALDPSTAAVERDQG